MVSIINARKKNLNQKSGATLYETFIYTVSIDILISRVNKYALPDTLYTLYTVYYRITVRIIAKNRKAFFFEKEA